VLTTVVARQPRQQRLFVDAGGLALSKDRSTAGHAFDAGYGLVCDLDGQPIPGLIVSAASQEMGTVTSRDGVPIDPDAFPVGRRLRILPNHSCFTAAAHPRYQLVDGGTEVTAVWDRVNGW
jgi:D-serine deaminase-like pyridoxal phosphate-dependent protein